MKAEQHIILEQQNEIRRLRRENRHLRRYVESSAEHDGRHSSPEEALLASMTQQSRLIDAAGYPRYLYDSLRRSSPFRIWSRVMTYFRRFRFLSVIFRAAAQIIAFIETSAILIVTSTIFVVTLPLLLIALLASSIVTRTRGRRLNRRLAAELKDKRIFVFFPSASPEPGYGSVMHATVEQLGGREGCVCFVVSPHTVSSRIFGQRGMFFLMRQPSENVFYIRRSYYFLLRRDVLDSLGERVSMIF